MVRCTLIFDPKDVGSNPERAPIDFSVWEMYVRIVVWTVK